MTRTQSIAQAHRKAKQAGLTGYVVSTFEVPAPRPALAWRKQYLMHGVENKQIADARCGARRWAEMG